MKRKRKQNNILKYIKKTLNYILKRILPKIWDEVKTLLLIVLGVVLFFNWLDINIVGKITSKIGLTTQDKLSPLKEDEKAKLTVNVPARRAHIQTKDGKTKTYHGVRKIEATEMIDGTYKFKKKNIGLGLEPGVKIVAGDGLGFGPDIEFAYWRNFALSAGFSIPVDDRRISRLRGNLALDYMPGLNLIPNTGVFIGIDTNRAPIAGVRVRF